MRKAIIRLLCKLFPRLVCRKESASIRQFRGWLISGKRNVRIGRDCVLGGNIIFREGVTLEDNVRLIGTPVIKIGKDVYINCFTMMLGDIDIGDDALISQYVNIWGRSHKFSSRDLPIWVQHGSGGQGYKTGPIKIGKGAWIGPHVTILRGVCIGDGAVIGANAVVTKDIPPYAVAMGIPAEVKWFRGEKTSNGENADSKE